MRLPLFFLYLSFISLFPLSSFGSSVSSPSSPSLSTKIKQFQLTNFYRIINPEADVKEREYTEFYPYYRSHSEALTRPLDAHTPHHGFPRSLSLFFSLSMHEKFTVHLTQTNLFGENYKELRPKGESIHENNVHFAPYFSPSNSANNRHAFNCHYQGYIEGQRSGPAYLNVALSLCTGVSGSMFIESKNEWLHIENSIDNAINDSKDDNAYSHQYFYQRKHLNAKKYRFDEIKMKINNVANRYYSTDDEHLLSLKNRFISYSNNNNNNNQEGEELKAHIAYTNADFSDHARSIWMGQTSDPSLHSSRPRPSSNNEGGHEGFCGVKDEKVHPQNVNNNNDNEKNINAPLMKLLSSSNKNEKNVEFRTLAEDGIIELFMFNAYDVYQFYNDQTEVTTAGFINTVSLFYSRQSNPAFPLNLRVALVGQKTFINGNPFTIRTGCQSNGCPTSGVKQTEVDFPQLLTDFKSYVSSSALNCLITNPNCDNLNGRYSINGYPSFDVAHFYTRLDFAGGVVGYAGVSSFCSGKESSGIEENSLNLPVFLSATIAHEMGHNLGMSHDGQGNPQNSCQSSGNIMAASSDPNAVSTGTQFSSCSVTYFQSFYNSHSAAQLCLKNVPSTLWGNASVCGNGFVEKGEQCDCGDPSGARCQADPCCIANQCKFVSGGTCSVSQGCCDANTCKPKAKDTICRPSTGVCDLDEICDGVSGTCPNDYYKYPGATCNDNGSGTCALGKCVKPTNCAAVQSGYTECVGNFNIPPCQMGCFTPSTGSSCMLVANRPLGTICNTNGFCSGSTCQSREAFAGGIDWKFDATFTPQCNGNCSIVQTRFVACWDSVRNVAVPDDACQPPKPASTQSCASVVGDNCGPDLSPPTWRNCPGDFKKYTTKSVVLVTWTTPIASDNRKVTSQPPSNIGPGYYALGNYGVVYTAYDAAGNVGFCKFNFTVLNGTEPDASGTDDVLFSIGGNDIKKSQIGYIAGGIGAGLVLIFITCYCFCGKRNKEVAGKAYQRPASAAPQKRASVARPSHQQRPSNPPEYSQVPAAAPRVTVSRPSVVEMNGGGGGGAYSSVPNPSGQYLAPSPQGGRLPSGSYGGNNLQVNIHHAQQGSVSYASVNRSPAGSVYMEGQHRPSHSAAVNFHG